VQHVAHLVCKANGVTATPDFARLVSLACHDLRTPLATVNGFARTLGRLEDLDDPMPRYLEMMATAAEQMSELLDDLGLVARIEAGRWEAGALEADTLELAQGAAAQVDGVPVGVEGRGASASVEPAATERALAALARCAVRHGGLDGLRIDVDGQELRMAPVGGEVAPILLGESLRDFGAAVAGRVVRALGGAVAVEGEALVVRLPSSAG
jgi:signal transduction histidine kinase